MQSNVTVQRQVRITHEIGVNAEHITEVTSAILELARIGQRPEKIKIVNEGQALSTHRFIQEARRVSRYQGRVNIFALLQALMIQRLKEKSQCFDIVLINSDASCGKLELVIGGAMESIGAVISTHRFHQLPKPLQWACIRTVALHEVGHVFGLVPKSRKEDAHDLFGWHCTNRCIMRQGPQIPHDWIRMTHERQIFGSLCARCQNDLRHYFSAKI